MGFPRLAYEYTKHLVGEQRDNNLVIVKPQGAPKSVGLRDNPY